MASPRRARSLFLSPDKAELLAAKEVNNIVHRVQVIPSRKPVPRQGRPTTDAGLATSVGDEKRASSPSTISTVEAFFREYDPPSTALHRLSYLNKELPPPPPSEEQAPSGEEKAVVSLAPTQRHAAVQTDLFLISRYSTQPNKSASRSSRRLSTISSQKRKSEDGVSIRSRFSTRDDAIGQDGPSSERRAGDEVDRRQRSVAWDLSKQDVRSSWRRDSARVSPGTGAHRGEKAAAGGGEIRDSNKRTEVDTQTSRGGEDPVSKTTEGRDVVRRSQSNKSKTSVPRNSLEEPPLLRIEDEISDSTAMPSGVESLTLQPTPKPTIPIRSDGLVLESVDKKSKDTAAVMTSEDENLALERRSKALIPIPIRWTFHDGFVYKAAEVSRDRDGVVEAKSRRVIPVYWSFHDGFTIRPDGSVRVASKATDGSPSKRLIYDGFTFRSDGSIKVASKATNGDQDGIMEAKSKRFLPVYWSFHDGFTIRSDGSVKVAGKATDGDQDGVEANSKRVLPIHWSFHDGFTFSYYVSFTVTSSGEDIVSGAANSKRVLPIHWSFHDGFIIRSDGSIKVTSKATDGSEVAVCDVSATAASKPTDGGNEVLGEGNKLRSMLPIHWSFHDGFTIRPASKVTDGSEVVVRDKSQSKRMIPVYWSFHDGFTIRANGSIKADSKPTDGSEITENHSKHSLPISWTFHDGFTIKPTTSATPKTPRKTTTDAHHETTHNDNNNNTKSHPILTYPSNDDLHIKPNPNTSPTPTPKTPPQITTGVSDEPVVHNDSEPTNATTAANEGASDPRSEGLE